MLNNIVGLAWNNTSNLDGIRFECGYCGTNTSPSKGYLTGTIGNDNAVVGICTFCNRPTYLARFNDSIVDQFPGVKGGDEIRDLPDDVAVLYEECLASASVGAHTSSVLTCRKILMHVAIENGADDGENFVAYVRYLAENGYLPPEGKRWVDYIRKRANEANHEINIMAPEDSEALIALTTRMLQFVYEMPGAVPNNLGQQENGDD